MRKGAGGSRRARPAGSGPGAAPLPVPVPGPGLCPPSRRCPRPLLPLLALAAAAALLYVAWPGGERDAGPTLTQPPQPPPGPPSEQALRALLGWLDPTRLRDTFLRPLLRERVPGGPGSRAARQHIMGHLSALGAAWHLELDAFEAATPRGLVTFTNVVATVAPAAPRRLVLACHYDTKVLPPGPGQRHFLGATDSAVPCAILLELAAALDRPLRHAKDRGAEVTLQLLFLDGEEAFGDWSDTDSLYGARHLAERMATTRHGPRGTQITAMSLLVLLDLLGARHPAIHSHFPRTHHWFLRLVAIAAAASGAAAHPPPGPALLPPQPSPRTRRGRPRPLPPARCPCAAPHPPALPTRVAHPRGHRGEPAPPHRGGPVQDPGRVRGRVPAALSPAAGPVTPSLSPPGTRGSPGLCWEPPVKCLVTDAVSCAITCHRAISGDGDTLRAIPESTIGVTGDPRSTIQALGDQLEQLGPLSLPFLCPKILIPPKKEKNKQKNPILLLVPYKHKGR
ncbi:glutaminyl-peptide cyclotransferase-like protein isoform X3 [Nyctibius grandis]|uniref:glutaminyl-peptide cyclotransferase-like protein isoform X3 n=1 Tax=Nyctibius grandis TaxID=48427 RepID=UPI0035BBE1C6